MLARLLCTLLFIAPAFAQPGSGQLKAVVILTRHGVRSPTSPMSGYIGRDKKWPDIKNDWHVACCADLTPRGGELAEFLGAYYRSYYAEKGLFQKTGCPARQVYIWADNEERTLGTANALAQGLLGGMTGCRIQVDSLKYTPSTCPDGCKRSKTSDRQDPLFHPLPALWIKANDNDRRAVDKVVADLNDPARYQMLLRRFDQQFQALQTTLGCCAADMCPLPPCNLRNLNHLAKSGYPDGGNAIAWTKGPFAVGSTASEVFLLEYANHMPCSLVGWNAVVFNGPDCAGPGQPFRLIQEVHTAYFRLVQQSEIAAQIQGSNLAYHILAQLQIARSSPPAARKLVIFSGHDTNISNVAALLKLSWKLPDLPDDDTPPAGALVFELYSGASPSADYVRIRYVHQTVPQLRSLDRQSAPQPPFWADLTLPGCAEMCSFQQFSGIVNKAILLRFVTRTRAQ